MNEYYSPLFVVLKKNKKNSSLIKCLRGRNLTKITAPLMTFTLFKFKTVQGCMFFPQVEFFPSTLGRDFGKHTPLKPYKGCKSQIYTAYITAIPLRFNFESVISLSETCKCVYIFLTLYGPMGGGRIKPPLDVFI